MTDCSRTSALLEVYADHEASPETNALVHRHLTDCPACRRELDDIRGMKAELRRALGTERAPDELVARIRGAIEERQPRRLAGTLRAWLAPASAAAIALALWTLWPPTGTSQADAAVSGHIACALNHRTTALDAAAAIERGYTVAMPWIRDAAHGVHVVDAHACGESPRFSHVIVSVSGSIASVFIAPRAPSADRAATSLRRGEFDVSIVSAAAHSGYLIAPREPSALLREWRSPVLDRITRFLEQLEGTL